MKYNGEEQISGTATERRGAADSRIFMRDFFKQFHTLYGEVLKWSKRRDSKAARLHHSTSFQTHCKSSPFRNLRCRFSGLRSTVFYQNSKNLIWRDIEVVITGLTRNQFVRKHTRVRIPLSPPKSLKRLFQALTFSLFTLHFSLDLM